MSEQNDLDKKLSADAKKQAAEYAKTLKRSHPEHHQGAMPKEGPGQTPKVHQGQKKAAVTQSFNSKQYSAQQEAGKKQPTSADRVANAARANAARTMTHKEGVQGIKATQSRGQQKQGKLAAMNEKIAQAASKPGQAMRKGSAVVKKVMKRQQAAKSQDQSQQKAQTQNRALTQSKDRGR